MRWWLLVCKTLASTLSPVRRKLGDFFLPLLYTLRPNQTKQPCSNLRSVRETRKPLCPFKRYAGMTEWVIACYFTSLHACVPACGPGNDWRQSNNNNNQHATKTSKQFPSLPGQLKYRTRCMSSLGNIFRLFSIHFFSYSWFAIPLIRVHVKKLV